MAGIYNNNRDWLDYVDTEAIMDKMPSVKSLSRFALSAFSAAQSVLGQSGDLDNWASCSSPQLSCHNTSAVQNLCCFNSPGGALLLTQFWDTSPVTGPDDSWTIHGLWPDNCDGTYEANCDDDRAYRNISAILNAYGKQDLVDYMNEYWVSDSGSSETFWEHEWSKHGTCISTLEPDCYTSYQPTEEVPQFFDRAVSLFKSLPSYDWLAEAGITPSSTTTYTLAQIESALAKKHGGAAPHVGCRSGRLNELWYFFNVRGSLQSGTFEAADSLTKSNCPSTGIKYLPKNGGSSPPSTTTTAGTSPTSSPGTPFSGAGFLNVVPSDSAQNGCIISAGTWYTSGTCATFHATEADEGFTLRSSKGSCGVESGVLACGNGVNAVTFTGDDDGKLLFNGTDVFSTDSTPSGTKKATVYVGSGHASQFTIQWQGK